MEEKYLIHMDLVDIDSGFTKHDITINACVFVNLNNDGKAEFNLSYEKNSDKVTLLMNGVCVMPRDFYYIDNKGIIGKILYFLGIVKSPKDANDIEFPKG